MLTSNRRPGPWLHCFALVFMLVPVMAAVANAARPLRIPLLKLADKVQQVQYRGENALERKLFGTTAPAVRSKMVVFPVRYASPLQFPACVRAKL